MSGKNIFKKMVIVLIATMIMTAVVLGLVSSNLYRGYFVHDRQDELLEQAQTVARLISKPNLTTQELQEITNLPANERTSILIFDKNAHLLAASSDYMKASGKIGQDVAKQALLGKEQEKTQTLRNGQGQLEVAVPVYQSKQITGAVVIRWLGLTHHMDGLYRLLFIAGISSVFVTFVFAYYFLKRVSRPLQEMNEIIQKMTQGDFSQKLSVRFQKEVGQLALAFNQMVDKLASLETMRRDFIAHASHELRSPLTSIRGFVGAILDGTIPVDQQKIYLQRIQRESLRLGKLVDNILDLSQLENDQSQNKNKLIAVSLPLIIKEVLESVQPLLDEKQMQVKTQLDEIHVYGLPEQIEQVMINLITNAVRFSPSGAEIHIHVRQLQDDGMVEVIDFGIGIPEEEIGRVFDRFYKVDKARTVNGGTGLGLAIAKRIIEMHGGKIGLDSTYGKGTCAWFTLPLERSQRLGL